MKSRILICGGRDYKDQAKVEQILTNSVNYGWFNEDLVIIEGGATGADMFGKIWALKNGYPIIEMPANWAYYGKKAGFLRNGWMLKYCMPDLVVAFPGGKGTANTISSARNIWKIDVWEIK